MRTNVNFHLKKMASSKRKYGSISKGMKLTIVVEEAVNDVLVVVLDHGSKVFRGVLLESTKRNLPPGICTSFIDPGGLNQAEMGDNSQVSGDQDSNSHVDLSATIYRHTYNQDVSKFGKQFQGPPLFLSSRRTNGGKPTRNIRLRPRQTMCSNCKSACLDSDNGPIPINATNRPNLNQSLISKRTQLLPRTEKNSVKEEPRSMKRRQATVFQTESERSQPKPTKLIKVTNSESKLTKTSPFIKISIGEATVMNIPPRIHELDKDELSSEEKCNTDIEDNIFHVESNIDESDSASSRDTKKSSHSKHKKSTKRNKRSSSEGSKNTIGEIDLHKKRKKSKNRTKELDENRDDVTSNIIITQNVDSEDNEDKRENSEPQVIEVVRPRLLYTWRQNKGLSPRHDSQARSSLKPLSPQRENQSLQSSNGSSDSVPEKNCILGPQEDSKKEYKLRSRSRSLDSNPEYEITEDSAYVSYEDPKSVSDGSEGCTTDGDASSETDSSEYGDDPPGEESIEAFRPLMMKIHTNSVLKCVTSDGRKIHTGDIVWGKIKGFPWWPGRVLSISISQRDNGVVLRQMAHIAWFGSSTMSHIQCSDLYPFLDDFKLRYKRKKRGPYKIAIKQATIAARSSSSLGEADIELEEFDSQ